MRESDSINHYEVNNERPIEEVIDLVWGVIKATFGELIRKE